MNISDRLDIVLTVLRSLSQTETPQDVRGLQDTLRRQLSLLPAPARPNGAEVRFRNAGSPFGHQPPQPAERTFVPAEPFNPPGCVGDFVDTHSVSSVSCATGGFWIESKCYTGQPFITGMIRSEDGRILCVQVLWTCDACFTTDLRWMP